MTQSAAEEALADTSVALPFLVEGHDLHDVAVELVGRYRVVKLAGHAWFETYSVLTRMPIRGRLSPAVARQLMEASFPTTSWLDAAEQQRLADRLAATGIRGGAVYDALVGWTAVVTERPLLSLDRRARPTYQALGVDVVGG